MTGVVTTFTLPCCGGLDNHRPGCPMPATPSRVQSFGYCETYTCANDGRVVEIRNGAPVYQDTRHTVEIDGQTADWVLANCITTRSQRDRIENELRLAWESARELQGMSRGQLRRSKYG